MCEPTTLAVMGSLLLANNSATSQARAAKVERAKEQDRVKKISQQERTKSDNAALDQRKKQNATRRAASSGQLGGMLAGAGNFMSARSFFS